MLNRSLDALHERRLAGDSRAGDRVRTEARRTQWNFVRRNWTWLATGLLIAAGGIVVLLVLFDDPFARGLIVGAGVVLTLGGLWSLVVQLTSTGSISMGAQAEVWTAGELRPLRKAGWKIANHLALRPWDVDHVLVGAAGVIAVETKWSSDGWSIDPPDYRLRRALEQVSKNARDLRLWRPELRVDAPGMTRAVLFLWGGTRNAQPKPADLVQVGDVEVVYGVEAAKRWRSRLAAATETLLSEEQVAAIWLEVRRQARRTDARESQIAPRPPSLERIYWTSFGVLVSGIGSVLASSYAYTLTRSMGAWAACTAAFGVAGLIARRVASLKLFAVAWLTGLGCISAAAAILVLRQQMR